MSSRSGLDTFLSTHHISTSAIARGAEMSRKHVITIRHGKGNPTEKTMRRIAEAAGRKLGRRVTVAEAFGFSGEQRRKAS